MEDFFSGNGYDIVDKKISQQITLITFGVFDMYNKAIGVMNKEAKENKPFFNHIMTVSNHRPFTFPNDKIDIRGDAKSRGWCEIY
jgi:phosphoglycerol transferase MdoB-like AlkP superfamily enzyme